MYFVSDIYDKGRYGKIMKEKDLIKQLIIDVNDDLENNIQDKDIVLSCTEILSNIASGNYKLDYIIDNLESYGWKVIDLLQIQRDLEDLKDYFAPNDNTPMAIYFNSVIDKINKGEK